MVTEWHRFGSVIFAQRHDAVVKMRGSATREVGGIKAKILEASKLVSIVDGGEEDMLAEAEMAILRQDSKPIHPDGLVVVVTQFVGVISKDAGEPDEVSAMVNEPVHIGVVVGVQNFLDVIPIGRVARPDLLLDLEREVDIGVVDGNKLKLDGGGVERID